MDLLWLALVIQTVFFIVKNAHYAIVAFVVLSLIFKYLKYNNAVSIIIPMIFAHVTFLLFSPKIETFKSKFLKKKMRKKMRNKIRKKVVNPATNRAAEIMGLKKENEDLKDKNEDASNALE